MLVVKRQTELNTAARDLGLVSAYLNLWQRFKLTMSNIIKADLRRILKLRALRKVEAACTLSHAQPAPKCHQLDEVNFRQRQRFYSRIAVERKPQLWLGI